MGQRFNDLPPWSPGDTITAARLNEVQQAPQIVLIGGNGIEVEYSGNQVIIKNVAPNTVNAPKTIFAIITFAGVGHDDTVTCNRYNPVTDTQSDQVVVAKPFMLRRFPFDGNTITYPTGQAIEYTYSDVDNSAYYKRVADDGVQSVTQVMTPMYFVGEIIRAQGGVNGEGRFWEDMNTCGRHWAKEA